MTDYRKFRKFFLLIFGAILAISCGNRGGEEQVYSGTALGTSYHIKYYNSGRDFGFAKGLDSIFRNINQSMSTYQKNTDISRINAGDSTVQVDDNFRKVFLYSDTVYKQSQGYFDPTVGNLVNAYGLGPDHILAEVTDPEIDSMMQYVGFNKVKITADNHIKKEKPEIFLDFNAIAKGYTIDVIAHYLDVHKVDDYLIEVGGELVAKGKN
ncbi:MAG: FAD:protein FMN transferase, partial [Gillisia sp.]